MSEILGTPLVFNANSGQSYTPESGADRLLWIASLESDSGAAPSACAATIGTEGFVELLRYTYSGGGKTVTLWVGEVVGADIPGGSSALAFVPTGGTGNQGIVHRVLSLLDSGTDSIRVSAACTVTGSPLAMPPSGSMAVTSSELAIVAIAHDRTAPTATASGWTLTGDTHPGSDAGQTFGAKSISADGNESLSVALSGGGSNAVGALIIVPHAAGGGGPPPPLPNVIVEFQAA